MILLSDLNHALDAFSDLKHALDACSDNLPPQSCAADSHALDDVIVAVQVPCGSGSCWCVHVRLVRQSWEHAGSGLCSVQVADIADVVRQRADALMLSGESAAGAFPDKAVNVLRIVATQIEEWCRSVLRAAMLGTLLGSCCNGWAAVDLIGQVS